MSSSLPAGGAAGAVFLRNFLELRAGRAGAESESSPIVGRGLFLLGTLVGDGFGGSNGLVLLRAVLASASACCCCGRLNPGVPVKPAKKSLSLSESGLARILDRVGVAGLDRLDRLGGEVVGAVVAGVRIGLP